MPPALLVFAALFVVLFAFFYFGLRKDRDPEWERRWRQLPMGDRLRISSAARRGEALEDPLEAELAAGSARQQGDLLAGSTTGLTLQIVVAVAIALAGVAQGSFLIVIGGLALLGLGYWRFRRMRDAARNLERAQRHGG